MKIKKAIINAYYNLGEEFLLFPENPLHNTQYENVDIKFKNVIRTMCGISFEVDIVEIAGQEPIECQLLGKHKDANGTLIIQICQDWG